MPSLLEYLQVIEFHISPSVPSCSVSLKAMRDLTHAFCPESCSRQVMIFFDVSNTEKLNKHFTMVSELAHKSAHRHGLDAYRFLLSWIVGGEYRVTKPGYKIAMFNDNHILGCFKERWKLFLEQMKLSLEQAKTTEPRNLHKEEKEQTLMNQYIKLIDLLLTDAHEIRKQIECGSYGKDSVLRSTLDKVLDNVVLSRTQCVPVLYEAMHNDSYKTTLFEFLESEINKFKAQLKSHSEESPAHKAITMRLNLYVHTMQVLKASEQQQMMP